MRGGPSDRLPPGAVAGRGSGVGGASAAVGGGEGAKRTGVGVFGVVGGGEVDDWRLTKRGRTSRAVARRFTGSGTESRSANAVACAGAVPAPMSGACGDGVPRVDVDRALDYVQV